MKNKLINFYEQSLEIRYFEEKLLKLFSEGKISGTTHTCIGQEKIMPLELLMLSKKMILF